MGAIQEIPNATLAEWGVAHAEARSHVFGKKLDGAAIFYRIGLSQIFHGLYQHFLAVNVAGIRGSLALLA